MDRFSEAYEAARAALTSPAFAGEVGKLRLELAALLADGGPSAAKAAQLSKLRQTLRIEQFKLVSSGKPLGAAAQAIVDAAGMAPGKQHRAATVKMLKHLYHANSAGGQSVWVYSPPMAYTKWIFDEVDGVDDAQLKNVMGKPEDEVYTESQKSMMSVALQTARKVCLDVVAKLGEPNSATLAVVRRYFGNSASTADELAAVVSKLRAGYQKIAGACNSSVVVMSDEPGDRNSGGWKDWAFIYSDESMRVIYLQDAWLKKAGENTPSNHSPMFRCARTIVHELSHKEIATEDVVYGPRGLMVQGSTALSAAHALHNADSWAYFSMDVTGNLTGPDAANGTTPCSAVRLVPARTLTLA